MNDNSKITESYKHEIKEILTQISEGLALKVSDNINNSINGLTSDIAEAKLNVSESIDDTLTQISGELIKVKNEIIESNERNQLALSAELAASNKNSYEFAKENSDRLNSEISKILASNNDHKLDSKITTLEQKTQNNHLEITAALAKSANDRKEIDHEIFEKLLTEIRLSDTKTHELQKEQFNIILQKITETKSKDNLQLKLEELKEKQQTYFRNMSIAMAIILIITLISLVMQWS